MEERHFDLSKHGLTEAPEGKRAIWRFQAVSEDGSIESVLTCQIPGTEAAVEYLNRLFASDHATTQEECDVGGVENCEVKNDPVYRSDPGCEPYLELDFSCDDGSCMTSVGGTGDVSLQGCTDPGGGAGDGGGGTSGGGYDTDLIGDEDATLSKEPPDCSAANLHPGEEAWCQGDSLSEAEATALREHVDNIIARCDFLSDDVTRARSNIRKYDRNRWGDGKGGWAPRHGDWIALSVQRIAEDFEMVLVHELLHLDGHSHVEGPDSQQWQDYKALEEKCSGGRSSLW